LLRLTGVPVIQDGLYFSIPSGNFEVIKACSGIRYLIATVALATLFAHFTYRSWRRILIFMSLALVVPIIGNSLRAYLIVMIAHLSKMKYAVGIDHFIYGWLMFALMIALLFWIGGRFREIDRPIEGVSLAANAGDRSTDRELPWSALLVAAIVVMIGSISPNYIRALAGRNINEHSDSASLADDGVAAGLPTALSPWSGPSAIDRAGVAITGESMLAEHRWIGAYRLADDKIMVQVFFYLRPSAQKARLTRLVEELYTPAGVAMPVKVWTNPAAPSTHAMLTWQMQSASVNALHFGWYLNPSGVLTSATGAKLSQAWSWLRLCPSPEAFVLISFPAADGDYERAERSAASFMERHSMLLDSSVIKILRASAGCAP
jgi:exosortase/archaeosortase family protein